MPGEAHSKSGIFGWMPPTRGQALATVVVPASGAIDGRHGRASGSMMLPASSRMEEGGFEAPREASQPCGPFGGLTVASA